MRALSAAGLLPTRRRLTPRSDTVQLLNDDVSSDDNYRMVLATARRLVRPVDALRFVSRYLERGPQLPLSLRQVDPLIRELTEYRDFIQSKIQENEL